jgi:copper transport protein
MRMIAARRMALCAGALTALAVLGWAAPAGAHAAVVSSSPVQGAHLAHAPHTVTVVFDQPVRPDNGGLVVLDSGGQSIQTSFSHPSPNTLRAVLPASLGSGAYVSNYTVTSVDGHVVSGGVVFLVGNVRVGASVAALARPRTTLTTWVDDFGQGLIYLGVLVATGLAFFLAFIFGVGPEWGRLRRLVVAATALGVIGMIVTGAAQAALTGGGIRALAHWSLDTQAFGGKFGQQCAAQLVGLAVCLVSLHLPARAARQFAAFYGLLIAAGAFVLFGHAVVSPERWLSIPADVVHVVLAAMWAGGLVGLVTVLRRRTASARRTGQLLSAGDRVDSLPAVARSAPATVGPVLARAGLPGGAPTVVLEREAPPAGSDVAHGEAARPGNAAASGGAALGDTARVVGRFSTMAGISFAGIVVAGTLLAVVEVGSVANLFETGYGQLLLLKIALVGLLLFLAAYNRLLLLPGLLAAAGRATRDDLAWGWRRLSSTVRLEALGLVAVLGVTSVLANGTPSNGASLPPPVVFHQTQAFDGGHVTLRVTPNQALVNDWTVQFTGAAGQPADLAESVSIYLVLPSQNVGPIEQDMKKVGVGHFELVNSPNPPIVGRWQVVLQVQVSEFSQPDVSFVDTVQ